MKINLQIARHKSLGISPTDWTSKEIRETFFRIVDDWCETRGIPLSAFDSRTRQVKIKVSLRDRSKVDQHFGIARLHHRGFCEIGVSSTTFTSKFFDYRFGMSQADYIKSKIDAAVGVLAHEICHVLDYLWGFSLDHDVSRSEQTDGWYFYFLDSASEYRAEKFAPPPP